MLFNQGDSADSVLYIEKGRVALAVMARSGKERICGVLGPGAFVGEEVLCGRRVRRESAMAMTPTDALVVLADCDLRRPCACVLPPVSQETIAEMVGTTRSRVNVFMGKFKRLGFIQEGEGRLLVNASLMNLVDAE